MSNKDIWDLISLLNINDGLFAFSSEITLSLGIREVDPVL